MLKRLSRRWAERAERHLTRATSQGVNALVRAVPTDATILEIGAGYNPRFIKGGAYRHIYHLDHADAAALRAKYITDPHAGQLVNQIQEVDFVFRGEPIETLVPPELRFDVIYSAHCLEHQVDLIGHLQSLEKLLAPGGRVIEIVPDLRRCFDLLRYPSVTADVIVAHRRCAPVHQGKQVFDAAANEVDFNLGRRPTDIELDGMRFTRSLHDAYQATQDAEQPGSAYTDRHAWTFIPESLRLMLVELRLLGLTTMRASSVSATYENQFCVVLQAAPGTLSTLAIAELEAERLALAKQLRIRG